MKWVKFIREPSGGVVTVELQFAPVVGDRVIIDGGEWEIVRRAWKLDDEYPRGTGRLNCYIRSAAVPARDAQSRPRDRALSIIGRERPRTRSTSDPET